MPQHDDSEIAAALKSTPGLLRWLPLIYVAWADGVLLPEESELIERRLEQASEIPDELRRQICSWLDPGHAPSEEGLQHLLSAVRRNAPQLPHDERVSLSQLAALVAGVQGQEIGAAEHQALSDLEKALGIAGAEAVHDVLQRPRPPGKIPVAETEASFATAALAEVLDGEEAPMRRQVRELLSQEEFAYLEEPTREEYRHRVLAWCRRLADEGLGALGLPQPYGAGRPGAFLAVFETLAHHDLSLLVKFGVQFGLFAGSIQQLGTEDHHRRYLPAAASLELPGCFAMTETGHGSNVQELETVARYDPETEEFVVDSTIPGAEKNYIGNAARDGRIATVFAQLETTGERHGVHAFLVPIRDQSGEPMPGVEIGDCGAKLGLDGVDNGTLSFDQVRIPRSNLLDRFGAVAPDGTYSSPIASQGRRFFTMLGTLVGGRVSVALASLSAAKSALTIAVRYGSRRRQFGSAGQAETILLDYLSHQRRLLPRLARTYALHFALRQLARRYIQNGDEETRRRTETQAAGLKAVASWHATETIQACRECCGGAGYMAENRFAALRADTDVFTTFEGDNVVLLQLQSRNLLSRLRHRLGEMNLATLARFLGELVGEAITERNPIAVRRTGEEHLRSEEFHTEAFEFRSQRLLHSLARRLKARLDEEMDPQQAIIECQDHLLATAHAHTEMLIHEQFVARTTEMPDGSAAGVLEKLRQLFALDAIHGDRGWFLEEGYLEGRKSEAIRDLINSLCGELRPEAGALVNAFAIPDELLAAPIALH